MADIYGTSYERSRSTPDSITISLPKLKGYKTLAVNAAIGIAGGIGLIDPTLIGAPPEAALTAIATAVIGIILRLMTSGPVPDAVNVLGAQPRGSHVEQAWWDGKNAGYRLAREDALARKRRAEALVQLQHAQIYRPSSAELMAEMKRAAPVPYRETELVPNAVSDLEVALRDWRAPLDEQQLVPAGEERKTDQRLREVEELPELTEDGMGPGNKRMQPGTYDHNGRVLELTEVEDVSGMDNQSVGLPVAPHNVLGAVEAPRLPLEPRRSAAHAVVLAFLIPFLAPSALVLTATALVSCASTREVNAVAAAETQGQKAFAAYSTFVALETTAAELVTDRRIPASVRRAIQRADAAGKPVADALLDAYRRLQTAKAAHKVQSGAVVLTDDTGALQAVEVATAALTAAQAALQPHLGALDAAVRQAKSARAGA